MTSHLDPDSEPVLDRLIQLQRWYRATRPAAEIAEWEPVAVGWESAIWGFTLDGRALVLREYHGADGPAKAALEGRVLRALGAAGFPVPEVIAVETDPRHLGLPFIILERITGPLLADRPDRGASELGRLQARLHRIDPRSLLANGMTGHLDSRRTVMEMLAEWRGVISSVGLGGFEAAMDFAEAVAPTVAPGRVGMVHWDLHPWNVIDEPTRGPVVIDWTAATLGDVRIDLAASTILWISNRLPEAGVSHLRAYLEESSGSVDDLEFFESLAATRRLFSAVAGLRLGPEALGMRPEAATAIRAHLPGLVAVYERYLQVGGPSLEVVEEVLGR